MKAKKLWNFSIVGASILVGAISDPAFAAGSNELIVRYREPQNGVAQARVTTFTQLGRGALEGLGLLNESEGLVKLQFESEETADAARAELLKSDRVESVAKNHYYHLALSLKPKRMAQSDSLFQMSGNFSGLQILPFVSAFSDLAQGPKLPDVAPAPAVNAGLDPWVARDWAINHIQMPQALEMEAQSSGRGIIAAVIDTGVDYNHEDLSGAMWRSPKNSKEVGFDFAHNNAKPYDVVQFDIEGCLNDPACSLGLDTSKFLSNPGHGTHCAGHVGAVANNSLGIVGVGSSVNAQVMALKFFYDAGEKNAGQGDDAAAIQSIDYAIRNGAKIISASWGGRMKRSEAEASELKKAIVRAQQAGVLFVVAAGNDGIDQESDDLPDFPAAYTDLDNMIVVAASDSKDQLADFSNYGAKSVHIAAPGVKILSTTAGSHYSDVVGRYKDSSGNQQEMDWDGTSMATPIVAGAAALVWSRHPNENYRQIRDRLLKSARKVSGLSGKITTGGVLNVVGALAD